MAETPAEDLMSWLQREEEVIGVAGMERASTDIEEAEDMLYEELGYPPSDAQLSAFMETAKTRYEAFPEIGITSYRFERDWGYQTVYRDVATGRFTSYSDVQERIAKYWEEEEK
jgi:hypothetical protein